MEISKHKEHDNIINVLSENFIKDDGLKNIYQQLMNYSKNPNVNLSKLESSKNNLNSKYLEGIEKVKNGLNNNQLVTSYQTDLPIYIKSRSENAKTLMICAMDPLSAEPSSGPERNSPIDYLTDKVNFWVPFSLIENKKDSNADFFEELSLHYNLYITDIYKLFFYVATNEWDNKKKKYKFLKSNSRPEFKKIMKHAEILEKEIEIIKPHCLITLGNNSRNALVKISKEKTNIIKNWTKIDAEGNSVTDIQKYIFKNNNFECNIISSPHISASANAERTPLLNNKKYNSINDEKATKKMAKIIIRNLNY
jgi:hypothetical protein